ncbi:MAG: hypothetical protein IJ833_00290 [Lachnospiraceae bacterium]|nr:hypothetical protein [Lachnospiraceae bacterium]
MGETPALQPYEFNIEKYDRIIFGTPVWASTFVPPLRTFINDNPDVKDKKIAVFTSFYRFLFMDYLQRAWIYT